MEAVLNLIVDTQLNQAHSRTSPGLDLISSKLDQLFSKLDNISSKNEQLSSRIDTLPMLTEILTFINRLEIKLGSMVPHVLPPAESQPTLTEVLSSVNHLETKLGSLVSNAAKTVETLEERLGLLEEPEENGLLSICHQNAKRMYDAHEDRIDVLEEHVNAPLADSKNDALVEEAAEFRLTTTPRTSRPLSFTIFLINKEVFEDLDRGLLSFEDSFNEIAESQVGDAIGESSGDFAAISKLSGDRCH
ncbi:hypothetical protein BC829DRAFT_444772 [Chytridium lagenaria]|nr:hypothetical protein BC829DRAFT_444772 [Chytridium lagenaria]